ncbi:MAG: DUF3048 domain-containing protein [Anaerolineae bacterium]|nr:DUF3048 domain-containing protein [Anaerolineae bacterium]
MHYTKHLILPVLVVLAAGLACGLGSQPATPTPTPQSIVAPTQAAATPIPSEPTPSPEPTVAGPYGPTGFPADVNPLTGLAVTDPNVLNRRPLLIKISNEKPDVRPQSGLSFADHVWEYQMEGMGLTRYTAVFYGQTPERAGSVRSARLIDVEHLMDMYGGILVYSGGSSNRHAPGTPPRINELVGAAPWVQRVVTQDYIPAIGASYAEPYFKRLDYPSANIDDYQKLFAMPPAIWQLVAEKGINDRPNLDGLYFDHTPPPGGTQTTEANIDYMGKGPKRVWRWDAGTGRWLCWMEDQQFNTPLAAEMDLLTNQQLAFDNVVILHAFIWETDGVNPGFLEDEKNNLYSLHINLDQYQNGFPAQITLLRDGMRFEGTWQRNEGDEGMIQMLDASGNPIALKPGTIWFQTVSSNIAQPAIAFLP